MRRVIFVDDEPRVLDGLRKSLRIHRVRWQPTFATSAPAALELLAQHGCDAIVTDARMPKMDGAQLLAEVHRRSPHTLRFVLSGQSDGTTNCGFAAFAHQVFAKPTPAAELFERIERACHLAELLVPPTLRASLCGVTHLPEFPWLYNRLAQELEAGAATPASLTRILAQGPALAARALQLTNSAFFSGDEPVTSLTQAAAMLGADGCRCLLASVVPLVGDGPMLDELSRRVTSLARLARAACPDRAAADAAYAAGLMSQLGTVVLVQAAGPAYAEVWSDHLKGAPLEACETARLGVNHLEAGATLLGLWNAPARLVDAVALHTDEPASAENEALTCALHLALAVDTEQQQSAGAGSEAVSALADRLALQTRLPTLRQMAREGIGALA